MPLISVITPSFNQARYIDRMISSLRDQTFTDFEHIVIDGGSTDGTLEILKRHESSYNLRWTSEPDTGMYNAINKGLSLASGDIMAYLNTDDTYFPWTLGVVEKAMAAAGEPQLIYGDVAFFDERTGAGSVLIFPEIDGALLRRAVTIPQPATFWRREVFERTGQFREDLRAAGDLDYWLRVVKLCRLTKVDEVLAADSRRPDALRQQFMPEYQALRRRGYSETGFWEARMFLEQAFKYYATGQLRLGDFTMRALLYRLGTSANGGKWDHFLANYAQQLKLGRLFLANIPTRRRLQGLGLLAREAVPAPDLRSSPEDKIALLPEGAGGG